MVVEAEGMLRRHMTKSMMRDPSFEYPVRDVISYGLYICMPEVIRPQLCEMYHNNYYCAYSGR